MHAQLKDGFLRLRLGRRFGVPEAERVRETVQAFAPLRQLTLDFTDVRDFEQSACQVLAKVVSAIFVRKIVLLGVTLGQSRLLKYLGADCTRSEPGRA